MRATCIVRRIDELGRVVIPKEIRRTLRIREGEALDIQTHVPLTGESRKSGDVVYTGSIIAELNDLETKEELIAYLTENISGSTFTVNQDAPSDLSR